MNAKQQTKWWIDAVLFAGFISTFFLDLTGVSLHQWIGLAAGLLASYHLFAHWNWVEAVTSRFFGKTSPQARLYYLVDFVLLAGFAIITLTGLLISTWLNLTLASYEIWRILHILASITTLLVLCLKIALHWRWIYTVAKNIFAPIHPVTSSALLSRQATPLEPLHRRGFLKVMGVVGAAALLALGKSLESIPASSLAESDLSETTAVEQVVQSQSVSQSTSSSCPVQCGRRCAYPGHCRRYVDSNNNNRCDLGECS